MENNKISIIRKRQKISQTELAERLNIDRTHLNKVENGKVRPSVALLERIAAELGVSIQDLF
ncbi:helix-turn-helix transcriptional regulator [Cytobacillus sp. FJAT-54145]|uniref:Helix-turn-helix transcriptional regulator n=1 Tax=Cytobacillus spartinae TaxID=3299023 RepID=A0ABW6KIL4_9BACI